MVARDMVWCAGTTQGGRDGVFKGRDPRTGEVKMEIPPNVADNTYRFHHRCYISKATKKLHHASPHGWSSSSISTRRAGTSTTGCAVRARMASCPPMAWSMHRRTTARATPETKLYGINAMAPKIDISPQADAE